MIETPLETYRSLRERASYHYADDSGKEWDMAYIASHEADAIRRKDIATGADPAPYDAVDRVNLL